MFFYTTAKLRKTFQVCKYKACLLSKEALFMMQTGLVYIAKKPCLKPHQKVGATKCKKAFVTNNLHIFRPFLP